MTAPYRIQVNKHMKSHPLNYYSGKATHLWSYEVSAYNNNLAAEYRKWCQENVGGDRWNYFGEFRKIPFEFKFKEEQDLLAFKIRFDL